MTTAVDEIRNVVLLFSNPSWVGVGTVPNTVIRNITALSNTIAYSSHINENTTVLAAKNPTTVNGLLYIPDLPSGDDCVSQAAEFVPRNAVRRANLPPTNYNLIGLAPWFDPACSQKYIASASSDPIRAFIFYRTTNSTDEPPCGESTEWDIPDFSKWRSQVPYPVVAVSGFMGQEMMRQLSLYSGNVTSVPFGDTISDIYRSDPEDYVRIWTDVTITAPSGLIGIWVYFLIIAAVLLVIISSTSLLMHLAQARRRASLRRRVISGEVNLEAMGIKRLTVPIEEIRKFPLYTYHYEPVSPRTPASPKSPTSPRSPRFPRSKRRTKSVSDTSDVIVTAPPPTASEKEFNGPYIASSVATDYQPTCEICLEPFTNRVTVIRELPCRHIFHTECIDEFLSSVSSLCPLCKASMLPPGHCPKITNSMVRRERAVRRLRVHDNAALEDDPYRDTFSGRGALGLAGTILRRLFNSIDPEPPTTTPPEPKRSSRRKSNPTRAERVSARDTEALARARMRELAGGTEASDGRNTPLTKWQKIRTSIFPGF
ncbi:hypothetical protein QBC39DRAFT_354323 [Podospora conica]|nr:hypothetical protein QBC39DRAFT_354323 [Schizothecium conicum]